MHNTFYIAARAITCLQMFCSQYQLSDTKISPWLFPIDFILYDNKIQTVDSKMSRLFPKSTSIDFIYWVFLLKHTVS